MNGVGTTGAFHDANIYHWCGQRKCGQPLRACSVSNPVVKVVPICD